MKELKQECGVTQISLENLGLLTVLHGPVRFILHSAILGRPGQSTLIAFKDGYSHVATGFASGYGGEGPHGLLRAIQDFLNRGDININHIAAWSEKDYLVLPGKGSAQSLHNFALIGVDSNGKHCLVEIW